MAPKKGVSPAQLQQLSDQLGLTVAAIADGTGLNKGYVSEFRNKVRVLTAPQQAKLRTYLQEKCAEAGIDFPDDDEADTAGEQLVKGLGGMIQRISRPAILLSDEIPKAQAEKLLNLIDANRLKVTDLLASEFKVDDGILGSGDFTPQTEDSIRQIFALLALNYLAITMLQGRNLVRALPADAQPKTMGDWLGSYLASSPLADLLPPAPAPAPATSPAPAPALATAEGDDE